MGRTERRRRARNLAARRCRKRSIKTSGAQIECVEAWPLSVGAEPGLRLHLSRMSVPAGCGAGSLSPLEERGRERPPRPLDALCAPEPPGKDGPLTPALSPSEGERENRRQVSSRFMGRRSSFSAGQPDILVRQTAGMSPRTAASRRAKGLLSPTLSSKGGEGGAAPIWRTQGDPLVRCSPRVMVWFPHGTSCFRKRITGLRGTSELKLRLMEGPAPGGQSMPDERFERGRRFRRERHAQFRAALRLARRRDFHQPGQAALKAGGAP
jgi:hypothetical protein